MHNPMLDKALRLLSTSYEDLGAIEQRVVARFAERRHVSHDVNAEFRETQGLGQRVADRVAAIGGSWGFILSFLGALVAWIAINSFVLARRGDAFDPYPYILLNLVLSMLAAIQAPVIMMSQNRQAAKDRMDAAHDYEVNLKAELEILELHRKLDALRERQWEELLAVQQDQIRMLEALLRERGIAPDPAEQPDSSA